MGDRYVYAQIVSFVEKFKKNHILPKFIEPIVKKLYYALPFYLSPEIVTDSRSRPDLIVIDKIDNIFSVKRLYLEMRL